MQEEELSVSEILSSIRQVLSKEAEALNSELDKNQQTADKKAEPLLKAPTVIAPQSKSLVPQKEEAFVLELTPQMRVNNGSLLSAETALKTQSALEKLNQLKSINLSKQVENDLKPILQDWLNANLPQIVEKIVTQEVRRIINAK